APDRDRADPPLPGHRAGRGPRGAGGRLRRRRGPRIRGDPVGGPAAPAVPPVRPLRGGAGGGRPAEPRLLAPVPGRGSDADGFGGQRGAPGSRGATPAEPGRRGARRGPLVTDLGERLLLLEQHVQRALELIERLRAENARLVAERAGLVERIDA